MKSQNLRVFKVLKKKGYITCYEARDMYIFRLTSRINDLVNAGMVEILDRSFIPGTKNFRYVGKVTT